MYISLHSVSGLYPGEWYEFWEKTSVTNEHRGMLFPETRTEATTSD